MKSCGGGGALAFYYSLYACLAFLKARKRERCRQLRFRDSSRLVRFRCDMLIWLYLETGLQNQLENDQAVTDKIVGTTTTNTQHGWNEKLSPNSCRRPEMRTLIHLDPLTTELTTSNHEGPALLESK